MNPKLGRVWWNRRALQWQSLWILIPPNFIFTGLGEKVQSNQCLAHIDEGLVKHMLFNSRGRQSTMVLYRPFNSPVDSSTCWSLHCEVLPLEQRGGIPTPWEPAEYRLNHQSKTPPSSDCMNLNFEEVKYGIVSGPCQKGQSHKSHTTWILLQCNANCEFESAIVGTLFHTHVALQKILSV